MTRRARRSILWRLYAVGVVQLALVASSAIAIGMAVERLGEHWDPARLVERLKPLVTRPDALTRELAELRARHGVELSLYAESGELIASNVTPPLPMAAWKSEPLKIPPMFAPPPPPPPPPRLGFGPHGLPGFGGPPPGGPRPPVMYAVFDAGGRSLVLGARHGHPRRAAAPVLLTLACGLVIVGAGAFLIRRWFARPLGQLSSAVRAFGAGELGARAKVTRSDEIGEVARAFDDMADRIQQLVLAEKELLANVSHELRTPLARIRVALDMAAEGDAAAARASLAEITLDLAELEVLLDDVLHATRLAIDDRKNLSASFALHLEDVSVQAIAAAAVQRFKARNPARPLQAEVECADAMLRVDPMLTRRVLDNLLENAHKYSPDPRSMIVLFAEQHEGSVVIEVRDAGMGISSEDLPHVFTAFFRRERSRSRAAGGVGLGLTLAKHIVEAHGGAIEVQSEPGSGTTVRVSLAVHAASAPAIVPASQ